MNDLVTVNIERGIAAITLNDPDRVNALSPAMITQFIAALDRADAEARVIILSGAGRGFCAGANLADEAAEPGDDGGAVLENYYNPMVRRIRDLHIPLVTKVHGAAAGVGAVLAWMGDIIVAAESAFFLQPFHRIGLVPDAGAPYVLVKAVGRVRAVELMLLGEKLPATRAKEWGLVTRVVKDDELDAAVADVVDSLASGATFALGNIRRMAWLAAEISFEEELALERGLQRETTVTQDFREGLLAFQEKRKPNFTGR